MKKELIKPSKKCKIRLTSNMMLCIPFFILWGVYMLLGAAMTPLIPMEESYKMLATTEKYIGIAICVYVCIYSLVSITQKDTRVIKRYLCGLLLVTGIIGFFYLESGWLYFDLVLIISLICAVQKSKKVKSADNATEVMNNTAESGSIKTIDQKKEQYKDIISYLKRGYSIRTIAKISGKGISTVQRIKKDFNL